MHPLSSNSPYSFIPANSLAGEHIPTNNWSDTQLGDVSQWPNGLKIALANLLLSGIPSLLFWGKPFTCFYNDAFLPNVGNRQQHVPASIWPLAWSSIQPVLEAVLQDGQAVTLNDPFIPMNNSGASRAIQWSFCCSPVVNDDAGIGGVQVSCFPNSVTKLAVHEDADRESWFSVLAEGTAVMMNISNEEGEAVNFNNAWVKLTGQSVASLVRDGWTALLHPDDHALWIQTSREAANAREPYAMEIRIRNKEGEYCWLLCSAEPRFSRDGAFAGYVSSCTDISGRKKIELNIRESEARFRSLIEDAPIATCLFVGDELVIDIVNTPMLEVFGKGNQVKGMRLLDAVPELADQPFPALLRQVLHTGESYEATSAPAILVKNGVPGTYYFDFSYKPVRNAAGEVYGVIDMAVDVTAEVVARKKLEESEAHLELLSNTVPAMIFYLDEAQRYRSYNETFMQWFGVDSTAALGKTVREFIGEQAYSKVAPHLAKAYAGVQEKFEVQAPTQILGNRWLSIVYTPHQTEGGKVLGVIVHATDVTQRREAELAIRESEARFRSLADNSPIFICLIEASIGAPVTYWNKTWLHYTGLSLKEALGNAWAGVTHPDDSPQVLQLYEQALESNQPFFLPEVRIRRSDGLYRWHAFKGNPRYFEDGQLMGYVAVGFDIHEQKLAEEELEHLVASRTEELKRSNLELLRSNQNLEEFAYAASHDLKEPVRKMQFFTNLLKEQLGERLQENELKSLGRIRNAAQRMGNLIDDLLLYSHLSQLPPQMEAIDLNEKLHRVLEDLELNIAEKKATIHIGNLPTIMGYRRQLQQLFQNLISNAIKYSKKGVSPEVHIDSVEVTEQGQVYHAIEVRDNGIGFEAAYADSIFQMFSRLHGQSEYSGTGIGLSIVKKVVENHHGFIRVHSEPDEGSVFTVLLKA